MRQVVAMLEGSTQIRNLPEKGFGNVQPHRRQSNGPRRPIATSEQRM
jgi:hypothetical protein